MAETGEVQGYPEGSTFTDRIALSVARVHAPPVAGISGPQATGAVSIVLNEGYEDDEDFGNEIVYTGHGGRDPNTGRQVSDQELKRGNLALAVSELRGIPVRVVRGPKLKSSYAPSEGYRYDGLYRVDSHWEETGNAGHRIWRFRLIRDEGTKPPTERALPAGQKRPKRSTGTVTRVVRDTKLGREVKRHHDFTCQVCGTRLDCSGGPYAEGAHIRPLGRPHDGPDVAENILCLCPNHHVLFDKGGFTIADDLSLIGISGVLNVIKGHLPSAEAIQYHRRMHRVS
jgi:putative restriction endonuclease